MIKNIYTFIFSFVLLPGNSPKQFAENLFKTDIHHWHSAPSFSPTMDELFFSIYLNYDGPQRIFVSSKLNGQWTTPKLISFSGEYSDGHPVLTQDGQRLYFYSKRPVNKNDTLSKSRIWFVNKINDGWSNPMVVDVGMPDALAYYFDHITADNKLYFSVRVAERDFEMYRCDMVNDLPQNIEKLPQPISIPGTIEYGSTSHPDFPYFVFLKVVDDTVGIYITKENSDGVWLNPIRLSDVVNEGISRFPSFSPDGKYFFFSSYRSGYEQIYWMKTEGLLNLTK